MVNYLIIKHTIFFIAFFFRRRRSLGGGVTLELGVYALQFALWVFGYAPSNVTANGKLNGDGVDEEANICMKFGPGRVAEILLSSTKRFDNKAVIQGTKGCITVS